ncbi:Endonuclease/exonuclease/phosphatase [Trinorchestia longiramus]|nr:Endonuclease/exonuclease/phosphatase [Trinorchestia longiramus]
MKKHYEDVSPFLSVLEIGAWKVKCRLPANQITSVGAIGPFGKDTSSEELTEALIDAGFGGVTVERIYKGKDKMVIAFFKVVFNTTTLPQFVRIGYQQYRVSTYIGKPWQCFRCQRFGHNAVNCRVAPRCVVCSGAHNSRECPSPSTSSYCNCSGNHIANYGGCPKIRQAREVEKIRQIQKLSYRDAARQVLHAGGTSLVQPYSDQTLNISMVTQSGDLNQDLLTILPYMYRDRAVDQLLPTHVIVGDFNAHNPLWEPAKSPNTTERNLEQILHNNPSLALLTPPSLPTYFNAYQNSFSTLDLTFLSAVLQPITSISTEQDLGSDHYPILTCIGVEPSSVRYKSRPSWRFDSGEWADWSAALQQPEMPEILEVEQGFDEFRKNMISASIKTFEQTKEYRSPHYNKT